ncbi:putative gustatory receptor 28b isoform X2 [Daphnia magna]|uniref:putative gustatory receptor 28b isoform X2 n=1 Tax=Daphnia magna TaxID=35525 RepID=UPI001E1BABBE|nr:putative gustatory receptor 28b isoform X2 [Daphnia magna]XP_032776436.2 putative gustatory receptor 28b isoform X2 [Daphnia magna]
MSVFEQLRPFVSLCQACGLIPYTMENSLSTKKFIKFTFSLRHFTTIWFSFIFILQLATIAVVFYFSMNRVVDFLSDGTFPLTITVVFGMNWLSIMAQLLASRWISLQHRQLQNAIEQVREVERLFGDKFIMQHKSSVMTRFILGFILVLLAVTGLFFVFIPVYKSLLPSNMGILATTAIFSFGMLGLVMTECIFLLAHLSYYIISHYIHLLLLHAESPDELPVISQKEEGCNMRKWENSTLILNHLCRASSELNSIFSFPTLFMLTSKFISVVSTAYVCVYSFSHPNHVLPDFSMSIPFVFFTDWMRIFVALYAADMPVNQVRLLRERIIAVSHSGLSQTLTDKIDAMSMLMQTDESRVRLSAVGLFNVGMHLIPALTGAAVTYMVILLQS